MTPKYLACDSKEDGLSRDLHPTKRHLMLGQPSRKGLNFHCIQNTLLRQVISEHGTLVQFASMRIVNYLIIICLILLDEFLEF